MNKWINNAKLNGVSIILAISTWVVSALRYAVTAFSLLKEEHDNNGNAMTWVETIGSSLCLSWNEEGRALVYMRKNALELKIIYQIMQKTNAKSFIHC